jgi:hypothetical protein
MTLLRRPQVGLGVEIVQLAYFAVNGAYLSLQAKELTL